MQDVLMAMAKAGAILMAVVVFTILISITTVKRGARQMSTHPMPGDHGAAAIATEIKRETRDGTVLEILVLGVVAFTLTMGLLMGISVLQHMN